MMELSFENHSKLFSNILTSPIDPHPSYGLSLYVRFMVSGTCRDFNEIRLQLSKHHIPLYIVQHYTVTQSISTTKSNMFVLNCAVGMSGNVLSHHCVKITFTMLQTKQRHTKNRFTCYYLLYYHVFCSSCPHLVNIINSVSMLKLLHT